MYYEATISRLGIDDNGKEKKFTEKYLIGALSIMEAITRFEEEISNLYPEHETKAIKRMGYSEVLTDNSADNRYFHTKYNTITIDEVNGKEKKSTVAVLIQADDFDAAKERYKEMIKWYMVDVELTTLVESKILDYFPAKLG